ncbi:ADP-ribosylation factor-like protein 10 isoform X1 [Macaca nemestrina]|uniref:ADP-ribosylation factor-like protein 10 isoform X1 n=1 Tax=Macaca nemestrina TaxID=9545 RepID=UPI0005F58E88|nr:ADP-ribosylation factor-like protein 10 isoform X1 [Macaca nemestrina]
MAPRPLGPLVLALGGAAAVLGSVLFILWKTYFSRGRERRWDRGEAWWGAEAARLPEWDEWDPEDEEDEEPALEELEQREVLVLGLDGAGKSTFLRVLSGKPPLEGHIPTWGFNSVRLPTKDFEVDLLERPQRGHEYGGAAAGAGPPGCRQPAGGFPLGSQHCPCGTQLRRAWHCSHLETALGASLLGWSSPARHLPVKTTVVLLLLHCQTGPGARATWQHFSSALLSPSRAGPGQGREPCRSFPGEVAVKPEQGGG